VRDLYPSTSKFARRGVGDFNGQAALPEPTDAPPGSPEKVAILEQRARLGQALWHPLDAPMPAQADEGQGKVEVGKPAPPIDLPATNIGNAGRNG
jgi:hypothetical protein